MSTIVTSIAKILGLAGLAVTIFSTMPASAGTQNLSCRGGYNKVATYGNSIKCRNIQFANSRYDMLLISSLMSKTGRCNAHSGDVTVRVFQVGSRYKVQASFICANIS